MHTACCAGPGVSHFRFPAAHNCTQLEQQYEHVVSQVIHSTSAERSFQRTLEAIRRLSREPYWASLPSEPLPK